ncbi:hypothetical protein [Vibrio barjaei]|uniref:PFGI-1 class ICE element type IV pilus protein PilL2 n=1 Tax=Vibrio barjaei TaxID=1676683 RepID=UPI002283E11C|nr:hypothetical protein [Vibrio barjaei]MCY9874540.1 hypothetical protein [Vibrio barjaei]
MIRAISLLLAIVSVNAIASQQIKEQQLSGYTKILVDTNHEQKRPMDKVTTVEFPSSIRNISQAVNYVLSTTGYSLKSITDVEQPVLFLYTRPVPEVNRQFHRASVKQIIQTLVGSSFIVKVDEISRTVSVEVDHAR